MSWRTPSHTFTSKPDPSLQNLTIFLALETNAAGKDCRFWHSPSHPVSWLGKFNGADKKNKLHCVHMCMCVFVWNNFPILLLIPVLSDLTSYIWYQKIYMSKIGMATLLETARTDYKKTYDALIKFEQDHCTVHAASVSWLSTGQERKNLHDICSSIYQLDILRLFSKMTPHDLCTR